MDAMDSEYESDDEPMSKEMVEDISDGIQYYPSFNIREAFYKVRDLIKQIQSE